MKFSVGACFGHCGGLASVRVLRCVPVAEIPSTRAGHCGSAAGWFAVVRAVACGSIAVFCLRSCLTSRLYRRVCLRSRPAFRFWRGGLPSFMPVFAVLLRCFTFVHARPSVSGGVFCLRSCLTSWFCCGVLPSFTPDFAALLRCFAFGSRLTSRFCCGVLPSFTPDFAALSPRLPSFTPGLPFLAGRFAVVHACLRSSVAVFYLRSRPAFRFWRGVLPSFMPDFVVLLRCFAFVHA